MVRPVDRAAMFEVLPDAVLVLDPDLVIADANPAYCALISRTLPELVGRTVGQVFAVNPQDPAAAQRLSAAYRTVLRSRVSTDLGVLRYDLPVEELPTAALVEYAPRYWSVCVVPVLNGDGEVELLLQRVREVTDVPAELTGMLRRARQPDAETVPELDVAAAALAAAELATALAAELVQMREAMVSRAVIEQAKGVLMVQRRCAEGAALAGLVETSQQTNTKLRDVCSALVTEVATQSA